MQQVVEVVLMARPHESATSFCRREILRNLSTNFLSYAIITTRYNCTLNKAEAFMNKWSPERAEAIRQFIDEYFMENRKSPPQADHDQGTPNKTNFNFPLEIMLGLWYN